MWGVGVLQDADTRRNVREWEILIFQDVDSHMAGKAL
jgi:hypothetical protein